MESIQWVSWILAIGGILAALTLYPYIATAIAYRGSDNGLAYILLVMGVALWNAMFAAQLLDSEVLIKGFFLSLSIVGASLAGLGWFLFAGTASSTTSVPRERSAYGIAAILVGMNIFLVITSPAHELYWTLSGTSPSIFVEIQPELLYWLHTLLLVILIGAGTVLFAEAWKIRISPQYTRAYAVAGIATILTVLGSNIVVPGGMSIAPLIAVSLTTIGWAQANQNRLRNYRISLQFPSFSND